MGTNLRSDLTWGVTTSNLECNNEALVYVADLLEAAVEEEEFVEEEFCEPTEEEIEIYIREIDHILEGFQISSFEDCEMVLCALQNVLIPNCEYLLSSAVSNLSPAHQQTLNDLTDRLNCPQNYVYHPEHSDIYSEMVEEKIGQTVSSLSIFSQNLAEQKRQEQQNQEALEQAQLDQILEISNERLMITLFLVTVELINRGRPLPETATNTMTPVLQKIKDEHITSQQINGLSQAELNRLVFDSASVESLEIVARLAAEHSGAQLGFAQ